MDWIIEIAGVTIGLALIAIVVAAVGRRDSSPSQAAVGGPESGPSQAAVVRPVSSRSSRSPLTAEMWVRIGAGLAVLVAGFLAFVPVTAVYYVDDHGEPYDVTASNEWWHSDQVLILPDPSNRIATSVRLRCATAIAPNADEQRVPAGPQACATAAIPRLSGALVVVAIAVLALVVAARLPLRGDLRPG